MAWPFSKQKLEIERPDTSHIPTTENMIIPDKQEEPVEEKPQIPTSVFDTVVATTTYALSDMFVKGNPYFIMISGKFLKNIKDGDSSKFMTCSGFAILIQIDEKRESGTFLMFVPHKNRVYRLYITITAEDLNANVNAIAAGESPMIVIEPIVDVPRQLGFDKAPQRFFDSYDNAISSSYTIGNKSVAFYDPDKF